MNYRVVNLAILVCCSTAACSGASEDDPQGTYQLSIARRTSTPSPQVPLPSTVSWPQTAELTLRFDDTGHAQVMLLGVPGQVATQQLVTNGRLGYSPPVEDGALELGVNAGFRFLSVDDLAACPQTTRLFGDSYFELFFLDGHVHGTTADSVVCSVPDGPWQIFGFDITGDRVSD